MSFNVSRFLVRVRQFWTRKRLVPVLGITAIFLFLLNFYTYLNTFFEKPPIIALHTLEHRLGPPAEIDIHRHHFSFDFNDRHDIEQHRRRLERDLRHHREHLKRHKHELERHHDQLRRRIRIHRDNDRHEIEIHEDGETKNFVIKGDEADVRIEVNGQRIKIDGTEIEI